ncbi:MAG: YkvA family protein [Leptolyngbya sp.]|nr:YkvA family protein [Leptolyngbya sp.]
METAMKKGLFSQPILQGYRRLVRHPKYRWAILLGTLIYLVSPVDIFPDVFPVVGWVDDGLIATLAITEVTQLLLDRKRNLRRAPQDSAPTPKEQTTVIDIAAVMGPQKS